MNATAIRDVLIVATLAASAGWCLHRAYRLVRAAIEYSGSL